ncbi:MULTISPECIES: PIN domain-containing protein [unclassified Okeania]|uniref:PIN domain-containing protein n=1 Tax=unclassified Okeania TaxID=2634635 RepID=UPI00338EF992
MYQILLKHINLYKEDLILAENLVTAYQLCQDIDETDTPHIALTIELDGLLLAWRKTSFWMCYSY